MKVKFYMDGDMWCCVDEETFRNIQESSIGFGADQAQAFQNYIVDSGTVLLPLSTMDALREALECAEDWANLGRLSTRQQNAMYRKWNKHPKMKSRENEFPGTIQGLWNLLRRDALALLTGEKGTTDGD